MKLILKKTKEIFLTNYFNKIILIFFLILITMFFEVLSISTVIPVISIILNQSFEGFDFFPEFINNYLYQINSESILSAVLITILVVFLIKNIIILSSNFYQNKFFEILQFDLTNKLFRNYLFKDYNFFINENTANTLRNLRVEVASCTIFIQGIIILTTELTIVLGIIFLLFVNYPKISFLIFIIIIPFSIIFYLITSKIIISLGKKRVKYDGQITKNIIQGINAIREIKILGKETEFINYLKIDLNKQLKVNLIYNFIASLPRNILEMLLLSSVLVIIYVLQSKIIIINESTTSVVALFGIAALRILPSASKILAGINQIKYRSVSINLIYDELKRDNIDLQTLDKNRKIDFDNLNIKFENVSFKYNVEAENIITGVNLEIPNKSSIGVFGRTGSGKSTFVDLLSGFLNPSEGKIKINNLEIKDNLREWQKGIGYVSQKVYLIDDTIEKNIAFGLDNNEIDRERIKTCLELSELEDFIMSLPEKEKTIVGENGVKLSGGQIQRIGIARSLYYKPEILIFDEATNALDNTTENKIFDTIKRLSKNKSVFIITHNKSLLGFCDYVIDISNNKVNLKKLDKFKYN